MDLHIQIDLVILIFAAFGISTRSQRDSTDENRPYKFGFNIEGYQHRFEEKNEKGIIMGEYGFITGDGVYHLTVYATDENGNFKIVRTKNIYIGLPGEKTTTRVPALSSLRPERVQEITLKSSAPAQGVAGCGGCLIPTTASPVAELRDRVDPLRGSSQAVTPDRPATSKNDPADPKGRQIKPQRPQILFRSDADERGFSPETGRPEKSLLPPVDRTNDPKTLPHEVNGLTMNAFSPEDPKTDLISKIPKMTSDIQNTEDLQSLFYLFNYTLTYHGHNEFGNRAGDKNGSYFFNGRDGFGRNVTYVANEFGYQPNISLYDLTEGETPREQTEKNSTKLLGNEFKWFYDKKTPSSAKK